MTIEEILRCLSCKEIFPDDKKQAEELYRQLMRDFHPDRNSHPDAADAAAIVNSLYKRVKNTMKEFTLKLESNGQSREFKYLREYDREDGKMYVGKEFVLFVLGPDAAEIALENLTADRQGAYTSMLMTNVPKSAWEEAHSFFPDIAELFSVGGRKLCIRISKAAEEIPLDEVLDFYGGAIDSRHAAWIISRLLGMCCFASLGDNVLDCLCTENLMINPDLHTVKLAGGWWFSEKRGCKLKGVQREVYDAMPASCKTDGIARSVTDLECVKAVCKKIFPEDCPSAVRDFAESAAASDPFEEMSRWEETIIRSFGGRFFTPMKLCSADIYNN